MYIVHVYITQIADLNIFQTQILWAELAKYMYTPLTTSAASRSTSEGERVTLDSSVTLMFLLQSWIEQEKTPSHMYMYFKAPPTNMYMYIHLYISHSLRSAHGGLPGGLLEEGQTPPLLLVQLIQFRVPQHLMDDCELLLLKPERRKGWFVFTVMVENAYSTCNQ